MLDEEGIEGDAAQLLLWDPMPDPLPDLRGPFAPHPAGGTRWQRWIAAQPPGPLLWGMPEC